MHGSAVFFARGEARTPCVSMSSVGDSVMSSLSSIGSMHRSLVRGLLDSFTASQPEQMQQTDLQAQAGHEQGEQQPPLTQQQRQEQQQQQQQQPLPSQEQQQRDLVYYIGESAQ